MVGRARLFFVSLGLITASLLSFHTLLAAPYGTGQYGECGFGTGCPQHTVTTTPSGLKVAVNLVDGQTVSSDGYQIEVTPLNGEGESFAKVDVYIDGKRVAIIKPSADGTARWFWDTKEYPGSTVKVIAYDKDGKSVTKNFTVKITDDGATPPPPPATPGSSTGQSPDRPEPEPGIVVRFATAIYDGAARLVQSLPGPVVVAFPYLLFIILVGEVLLLIYMTRREAKELATLTRLITQQQTVSALKQDFVQLVSHYLRTPLTLLTSGVDGLARDGVSSAVIADLKSAAAGLATTVETTIAKGAQAIEIVQANVSVSDRLVKNRNKQQVIVWLPVIVIGLLATAFVFLANNVTKYSVGAIGFITQLVVFAGLAFAVYSIWRQLALRRRDKDNTQLVHDQLAAVQAARDDVIEETASGLKTYIDRLEAGTASIPATATNLKFIRDGIDRLNAVQGKFQVASNLKGGYSTNPYGNVSLKTVFDKVNVDLGPAAQAKNITLSLLADGTIPTQDILLTTLVLETVLDNAIAYSAEGGSIEIEAREEAGRTHVFVTDHGVGIPVDKLAKLFQPFSKVEGAEVFDHEGMGFSLYLDKLVMTYLGGDIDIQSSPGRVTRAAISFTKAA